MAIFTPSVNLSYPKPRGSHAKYVQVVRTDTTAFVGAWLPKGSVLIGAYVIGQVASDAGTTATVDVGTTSTANEIIASYDVKTAATGEGYNVAGAAAVGTFFGVPLTADTPVYAKYTESGTASNVGGPWIIKLEYFVTGPGETL